MCASSARLPWAVSGDGVFVIETSQRLNHAKADRKGKILESAADKNQK
jgi:hypothetical protein